MRRVIAAKCKEQIRINDTALDPKAEWGCGWDIQNPSGAFLNTSSSTPCPLLIWTTKWQVLSPLSFSAFSGGGEAKD